MKKSLLIVMVALLAPVAAQPLSPTDAPLSSERLARIRAGFPDKTVRDPFLIAGRPDRQTPPPPALPTESPAATPATPPAPRVTPVDKAPALTVSGIVTSGSGNQAIVKSTHQTHLVKAGDHLGDLRVAAIDVGSVTLTRGQDSYKIRLPK